jgi:hypothetical protein
MDAAEYRTIPLTQRQVALVDAADYERLSQYRWCAQRSRGTRSFIAVRNSPAGSGKRSHVRMAREIMEAPPGVQVDHKDHNTLNNQRGNLRLATPAQNQQNVRLSARNTSGFKGIWFDKQKRKWRAEIRANTVRTRLGWHRSPERAHAAYLEAAYRLHGEFACPG